VEGREGSEGQSRKEEKREGRSGKKEDTHGPLANERLNLDICAGVPEFLVTQLLMGLICLLSEGRFEELVAAWLVLSR